MKIKNTVLGLYGRLSSYGYKCSDTVFITGSPRSGTTWLAELIGQVPGAAMIWEPFHLRHQPELRDLGFGWRTYLDSPEEGARMQIVNDVISGRRLNRHTLKYTTLKQLLNRKFWIIKSVRANWFVNIISTNFNVKIPICIIRHPCAVVSSQMYRRTQHQTITEQKTLQNWEGRLPETVEVFIQHNPDTKEIFNTLESWEEILAARWCMDNYEIIKTSERLPYLVLPYEKMVSEGEKTLQTLMDYLQLPWDSAYLAGLNKKSKTVVSSSGIDKGGNPMERWKDRLTGDQTSRILKVVSKFNCSLYNGEVEPDYELMNSKSACPF